MGDVTLLMPHVAQPALPLCESPLYSIQSLASPYPKHFSHPGEGRISSICLSSKKSYYGNRVYL